MRPSILIIDDQFDTREIIIDRIKEILPDQIPQIYQADNPMQALELFNRYKNKIGHIICDQYMPTANGNEFCEVIKNDSPHIPIVLFTGDQTILDSKTNLKNIDMVFFKPNDIDKLIQFIIQLQKEKIPRPEITTKRNHPRTFPPVGVFYTISSYDEDTPFDPIIALPFSQSKGGLGLITLINDHLIKGHLVKVQKQNTSQLALPDYQTQLAQIVWLKLVDSHVFRLGLKYIPDLNTLTSTSSL